MEKSSRFAIVRLEERIAPCFLNIFKCFTPPAAPVCHPTPAPCEPAPVCHPTPAPAPCEPTPPVCHPTPAPVCQPTPCFTFTLPKLFGCR